MLMQFPTVCLQPSQTDYKEIISVAPDAGGNQSIASSSLSKCNSCSYFGLHSVKHKAGCAYLGLWSMLCTHYLMWSIAINVSTELLTQPTTSITPESFA